MGISLEEAMNEPPVVEPTPRAAPRPSTSAREYEYRRQTNPLAPPIDFDTRPSELPPRPKRKGISVEEAMNEPIPRAPTAEEWDLMRRKQDYEDARLGRKPPKEYDFDNVAIGFSSDAPPTEDPSLNYRHLTRGKEDPRGAVTQRKIFDLKNVSRKGLAGEAAALADFILSLPGFVGGTVANLTTTGLAVATSPLTGYTQKEAWQLGRQSGELLGGPFMNPMQKLFSLSPKFKEAYEESLITGSMEKMMSLVERVGEDVEKKTGGKIVKEQVQTGFDTLLSSLAGRGLAREINRPLYNQIRMTHPKQLFLTDQTYERFHQDFVQPPGTDIVVRGSEGPPGAARRPRRPRGPIEGELIEPGTPAWYASDAAKAAAIAAGTVALSQVMEPEDLAAGGALAMSVPAVKGKGGFWHDQAGRRMSNALFERAAQQYLPRMGREGLESIVSNTTEGQWARKAVDRHLNRYMGAEGDPLDPVVLPSGKTWGEVTSKIVESKPAGYYFEESRLGDPEHRAVRESLMKRPPREGALEEPVYNVRKVGVGEEQRAAIAELESYMRHVGDWMHENVSLDVWDWIEKIRGTPLDKQLKQEYVKKMGWEPGTDPTSLAASHQSYSIWLKGHPEFQKAVDANFAKYDLTRAVKETAAADARRQKAMEGSEQASVKDMVPYKEYPSGWRWMEHVLPKRLTPEQAKTVRPATREEGRKLAAADPDFIEGEWADEGHGWVALDAAGEPIKNTGNDPFKREQIVGSRLAPEEAWLAGKLVQEGNVMGNCVGGYCREVSGDNMRIFALKDPQGKSHATISTAPGKEWTLKGDSLTNYEANRIRSRFPGTIEEYQKAFDIKSRHSMHFGRDFWGWLEKEKPEIYQKMKEENALRPYDILEMEYKQNSTTYDPRYGPYVRDFVKSGKWGVVGGLDTTADMLSTNALSISDLTQAGLDIGKAKQVLTGLRKDSPYLTKEEYETAIYKALDFPEFQDRLSEQHPNVDVDLQEYGDGSGRLELVRFGLRPLVYGRGINLPKGQVMNLGSRTFNVGDTPTGFGKGQEALGEITKYADANGREITTYLRSEPGGPSVTKLREIFERKGFRDDPQQGRPGEHAMRRPPASPPPPEEGGGKGPGGEGGAGPGGLAAAGVGAALIAWLDSLDDEDLEKGLIAAAAMLPAGKGPLKPGEKTTRRGTLNADKQNLIDILGSSMYSSGLGMTALKEMFQNAFDAVKAEAYTRQKRGDPPSPMRIDINVDGSARTISISENGIGMSPDIVEKAFFTIAGTEKGGLPPELRSGGFGLAKMAFILGSEWIKLETNKDGVKTTVEARADDIRTDNFEVHEEGTEAPNGTKVTVRIPESYIDPRTEEKRNIWMPWDSSSIPATQGPLIGDVDVYWNGKQLPIGNQQDMSGYQKLPIKFAWGDGEVYFGIERKQNPRHVVLSSGIYQFEKHFAVKQYGDKIPYDIVIDLKSKVPAQDADYPFTNSREAFRTQMKEDVEAVEDYLRRVSRGKTAGLLKQSFSNFKSMPRVESNAVVGEAKPVPLVEGETVTPAEQAALDKLLQGITIGGGLATDAQGNIVGASEKMRPKTFTAAIEAPKMEDMMKDMTGVDPSQPIFHNNTNVNWGKDFPGSEVMFAKLGTVMVDAVRMASEVWSSMKDTPLYSGISIDKDYRGVKVKVPYDGFFINPLGSQSKTLSGVVEGTLHTIVHEIAHHNTMSHDTPFAQALADLNEALADSGNLDILRQRLRETFDGNLDLYAEMRGVYDKSTTTNVAESLEGSALPGAPREGGLADVPGPVGRGRGPGVGEELRGDPSVLRGGRAGGRGGAGGGTIPPEPPAAGQAGVPGGEPGARGPGGEPGGGPGRGQRGAVDRRLAAALAGAGLGVVAVNYLVDDPKFHDYLVSALLGGSLPYVAKIWKTMEVAGETLGGMLSTRYKGLSEAVHFAAQMYEREKVRDATKYGTMGVPFIREYMKIKDPEFKRVMLDNEPLSTEAALLAQQNPAILNGWVHIRDAIKEIGERLVAAGKIQSVLPGYFPRVVKDPEGLFKHIKDTYGVDHHTELMKRMAEAEAAAAPRGGLSPIERSKVISDFMQYMSQRARPGYARGRTIPTITREMMQFYYDLPEAYEHYITHAADDLAKAKFFGRDGVVDAAGNLDVDASVGRILDRELAAGRITWDKMEELRKTINAHLGPKSPVVPESLMRTIRDVQNITYASLLGNIVSAVTQAGDPLLAIYAHGLVPTLRGVVRRMTGNPKMNIEAMGLVKHISDEFQTGSKTAKYLDATFKTGFALIDRFGKKALGEAAYAKWEAKAKSPKGLQDLAREYSEAFGDKFPALVDDLQHGRVTDLTHSLLWLEIARLHPISPLEAPMWYNRIPDLRPVAMLKRYMMKQYDVIRRDAYQEIKKGNVAKGTYNLTKYALTLSLGGVAVTAVQNWLENKPMDENFWLPRMDNVLKTFGLNAYVREQIAQGNWGRVVANFILPPPVGTAERALRGDMALIPGVGRIVKGQVEKEEIDRKAEKKARREEREESGEADEARRRRREREGR